MSAQPGFVRARMYRALSDDAELRFINVAEWESGVALDRAQADPEFQASVQQQVQALHITARPMVYQVAVDVTPGEIR